MSSTSEQESVRLEAGKHGSPEDGVCIMELASIVAGEPFSDYSRRVCPVIGAFLRGYNNLLRDDLRQDLLPPMVGRGLRSRRRVREAKMADRDPAWHRRTLAFVDALLATGRAEPGSEAQTVSP